MTDQEWQLHEREIAEYDINNLLASYNLPQGLIGLIIKLAIDSAKIAREYHNGVIPESCVSIAVGRLLP